MLAIAGMLTSASARTHAGEMKRAFEMQSALEKPLISKILGAVKKVETAVSSYDGAGSLGRWGVAGMLGAIQRYVIAADLSGLVSYLDRESAAVLKQMEGEQAVLVLGVFAHVCFAFKVSFGHAIAMVSCRFWLLSRRGQGRVW